MKAALYEGLQTISIVNRPIPKPKPRGAIIKIELCGICGTDMHAYYDGILSPGIVLGHENVGTVFALGREVDGFRVGDRVVAGPPGPCGGCYQCVHGRPSLCESGFSTTNGLARDGGMAEYMLVEDAEQMLYLIPESVSFEDAVLVDTMATAFRGIVQSAFSIGDNVVIAGGGPIGLATAQFLKLGGALHVTVLEVVERKRALARAVGADLALEPDSKTAVRLRELYGGIGADVVFECTGRPDMLQSCAELTRPGGQVLNLGVSGEPSQVLGAVLVQREIDIRSSLAYSADEAKKCLRYLSAGRFATDGMLSDVVPLDDLVERGFRRLAQDKTLMKIAVKP